MDSKVDNKHFCFMLVGSLPLSHLLAGTEKYLLAKAKVTRFESRKREKAALTGDERIMIQ